MARGAPFAAHAAALAAVLLASLAVLVALPVSAHDEAAAPMLRPDVLAAGHEPAVVHAGDEWTAFVRMAPTSNVTSALFQVCRVGQACFAPPAPATSAGNGTFTFKSTQAGTGGAPVVVEAGWRVGVKWYLVTPDGNMTPFPPVPDGLPVCVNPASLACQENHYLAFDVAPAAQGIPGMPLALAVVAVGLVAGWKRHG